MEVHFGPLRLKVFSTVYPPAEDSFMLAKYATSLSGKILDMGTGTGIAALSAALGNSQNKVLGLDINSAAVRCAAWNASSNGIENASFLASDLFSSCAGEKFDAILFNPPYLPTTQEEKLAVEEENIAYDGGESGLETFYKFSSQVKHHLLPGAKVAVISSSLGGIEETLQELEDRVGSPRIIAQENFFFEKIALIEAVLQ
ncbi:MAG: methyltransferase [Candidatus Anstonellaceae archaeon]